MSRHLSLFTSIEDITSQKVKTFKELEGLLLIENYISREEEKSLIKTIDNEKWLDDLKRRVQHYGYKYDYKTRRIDISMRIGNLPIWALDLGTRLQKDKYFQKIPDQLIINEYQVGQGITPHIDCKPCFEDTIVSISLNSTCVMNFTHSKTKQKISVFLPRRSAVVLKEESRYIWKHSIPARKKDIIDNKVYHRQRRVSLTFRSVIL